MYGYGYSKGIFKMHGNDKQQIEGSFYTFGEVGK